MKQITEFDLPEEREEYDAAYHGTEWKLVVWHMREYLFRQLKDAEGEKAIILGNVLADLNHWVEEYRLYL